MARQIRLNAFDMNCVGHQSPGLWAHPRDRSWQYKDLDYWTDLAKILERGKFDGLFIADVLGIYDVYNGNGDAAIRQATQRLAGCKRRRKLLLLLSDGKPNDFPLVDILVYKVWYQKVLGMKVHHPLNLVPYIKKDAEDELNRRFGWQRFQHKHHESRFTRFYEDYWMPRKFGYEKRRAHFSSLIMTGQMTREAALQRLASPEMDEHFLKQEFEYVAHKLDLTVDELQQIFEAPKKTYRDYRNKRWMIGLGTTVLRKLGLEKRHFR